jgi:hypothetical protein
MPVAFFVAIALLWVIAGSAHAQAEAGGVHDK